jgi:hypothetical protein
MYSEESSSVSKKVGRETEINRVMTDLSKAVECLSSSIEATEARLTGITRNATPSETKEQADTPYETQLAQDLDKVHNRIQGLRARLDSLLNRIEI